MNKGKKNRENFFESKEDDQRAVWKRFIADDQQALSEIYDHCTPKLYNYCRQFSADDALIWDVIQDLFYDLIRKKKNLSFPDSVMAYLLASIRRSILDRIKKGNKIPTQSFDPDKHAFQIQISEEKEKIKKELSQEQKEMLESVCNQLPTKQREAILLRFYEGLSYEEIAQVMGMTRSKSARALIYRALESLSRKLKGSDTVKGLVFLYSIAMV